MKILDSIRSKLRKKDELKELWNSIKTQLDLNDEKVINIVSLVDRNFNDKRTISLLDGLYKITKIEDIRTLKSKLMPQSLSRRNFLKGAASMAGLIALLGNPFSALAESELNKLKKDKVVAGKLYILPFISSQNVKILKMALEITVENFKTIGIYFDDVQILDKPIKINKLDLVMIAVEGFHEKIGQFGFGKSDIEDSLGEHGLELFNFYGELQSMNNLGFFNIPLKLTRHSNELVKRLAEEFPPKDITKLPPQLYEFLVKSNFKGLFEVKGDFVNAEFYGLIQAFITANTLTHEVAHSFGAAHIVEKDHSGHLISTSHSKYFLSLDYNAREFHPLNIKSMKDFIKKVKDKNIKQIMDLREYNQWSVIKID